MTGARPMGGLSPGRARRGPALHGPTATPDGRRQLLYTRPGPRDETGRPRSAGPPRTGRSATALERFRLLASGRIGIRTDRSGRVSSQAAGRPRLSGPKTRPSPGRRRPRCSEARPGAERPEPVGAEGLGHLVEVVDDPPVEVRPVVEAGPADLAVVEQEAERPDQPEDGPGRHAGPADRARRWPAISGSTRMTWNRRPASGARSVAISARVERAALRRLPRAVAGRLGQDLLGPLRVGRVEDPQRPARRGRGRRD